MVDKNTILITGAHGVLGIALQKLFNENDIKFIAPTRLELNLLDNEMTAAYIEKHKPSIVIHLAAMVFGLGGNIKNQMDSTINNTTINNVLFSALYKYPPQYIFFAGTVASYAFPFKRHPLQEDIFFDGLPHYGEFGYAMAKKHAYTYLEILKKEKGVSFTYGIFTNLFGENDNFDIDNGHVIPSLIAKAYKAKQNGIPLEVWGNGEAKRDFLYAGDAAQAIYFLMKDARQEDIINISSGQSFSIKQCATIIAKAAAIDAPLKFLESMPVGIMHREISNKKLLGLGFQPTLNFEETLVRTYQWYVQQQILLN